MWKKPFFICLSAACAPLSLEGALQPLQRSALLLRPAAVTLTAACSLTIQPLFGEKKKKKNFPQMSGWEKGMSLRRWLLGDML